MIHFKRKYWFIFSVMGGGGDEYHGICSDLNLEVDVPHVFSTFVSLLTSTAIKNQAKSLLPTEICMLHFS